ncbi:MAG: putative zinc-binding protein [Candidatus Korarchaeum sp.]|nr:putative zinc-binding protein [Candidatus Korarchaeum sp.]
MATCDGASSVGQIGNEVARMLTKEFPDKVRMCCLSAVAAGSKTHLDIFRKTRAVLAINGCQLMCASNVLKQRGIEPAYEVTISNEGVSKVPSLDFSYDAMRVAEKIVEDFLKKL